MASFACDDWLQNNLLHAGVLWHLILFVFKYDYTLDEGGVETSDESNQQEVANNLARLSIIAVAKLAGFKRTYACPCMCMLHTCTCDVIVTHLFHAVGSEEPTPDNPTIQNVIRTLFTPYLTKAISRNPPNEVMDSPFILSCDLSCDLL